MREDFFWVVVALQALQLGWMVALADAFWRMRQDVAALLRLRRLDYEKSANSGNFVNED